MMCSVCSFASAEGAEYTVKTFPVVSGEEKTGTMDLRFCADTPNDPCYGMKAYVDFLRGEKLTLAEDGGV